MSLRHFPQASTQDPLLKQHLLILLSPKSRERINSQISTQRLSLQASDPHFVKLPLLRKVEQTRGNVLRWKFSHISLSPPRRVEVDNSQSKHTRSYTEKCSLVLPKVTPQGAEILLQNRLFHEALCKSRRLRGNVQGQPARLSRKN